MLLVHLGSYIDLPTLKRIEEDRPTTATRILHALQTWLDRDIWASWEKVVSALKNIGKYDLALQVHSQYCSPLSRKLSRAQPYIGLTRGKYVW